jgi:hypothetical protein
MKTLHVAAASLLAALLPAAASAQTPPSPAVAASPMGDDPTRRKVDYIDNDIIGRTDQTEKAMEAAAEARGKKNGSLRARPAKAADMIVGALVTDRFGEKVGAIASLAGPEAVIATDLGSIRVPAEALGKSSKGLLVDMTKKSFDQLVTQANATASK